MWNAEILWLSADESRHLLRVCRVQTGDEVCVTDGQGRLCPARLAHVEPLSGERGMRAGLVLTGTPERQVAPYFIALIQAVPKGERMEWLVEKATELGVSSIYPVATQRSVKKPREPGYGERLRRVALSAAKQCGTPWLPVIAPVGSLKEALDRMEGVDRIFLASLAPGRIAFHEALAPLCPGARVALLIGPEGDFTPEEIGEAARRGAVHVSFGPLVLRVETAGLYGLSVLKYHLDRAQGVRVAGPAGA